ncbi:glycyl-tRNA synthetase subunit beta [Helicobacter mustelae]|uniref:glycine--tRNA ligase subunit beta n=1 Tax=Helicobacter mustelae TaxID=217 RepID=UPI000E04FAC5|nr:glycine--tRNA ligase subunit beta [Helicobacter mustelae]STP12656.1 glycyl-tRNA synthetase subunit beta [Helicobacter mustelae]
MVSELFIEIFVEELPALPFLREFKNFATKWQEALQRHSIPPIQTQFFYTPRRIVLFCEQFPIRTQEEKKEIFGPPVDVAFEKGDKNAPLTAAGEAFLKKNHLQIEQLCYAQKGGKEVLFSLQVQEGVSLTEILPQILKSFLQSLHFGKHMRWGNVTEDFIRPIRNIMIFLGEEFVPFVGYGIEARPQTKLHRDFGLDWQEVKNFADYCKKLNEGGVILDQEERRKKILSSITSLEKSQNIAVEVDGELLDEVVAITEYPQVILGHFEERFLELPKEVIITSMKENQRYFAVYQDKSLQHLKNHFVMVSNSTSKDEGIIVLGNQKVLRARLEDAMFFYHNDCKKGLSNAGLEKLLFIEGAGSMQDKVKREQKIAEFLIQRFDRQELSAKKAQILECIELSKADLLSEMVYEFSNLQGVMGYYYALVMKKDPSIALGIKEQYLPLGEHSALPSTPFSAIVALAHKFDNILVLFSVGKIPTGSKDPFALRRAANGILRIILQESFDFDLKQDLAKMLRILDLDLSQTQKIATFFIERMDGLLQQNRALLKSVLATNEENICRIFDKAHALGEIFTGDGIEQGELVATFKRVANILKSKIPLSEISQELLIEEAEKTLYHDFLQVCEKNESGDYLIRLKNLCGLKGSLDDFFDKVMVNVENPALKQNRIQLIAHIYEEFLQIADIKEIHLTK